MSRSRCFRPPLLVAIAAISLACEARYPELPLEMRTIEDDRRGVKYVIAQGWQGYDGGMRAMDGTWISVHVYDLEQAERTFVEGLPESLFPQLDAWSKHDFLVEGDRQESSGTVGPEPATVAAYVIRTRPEDKPGLLRFFVVRREHRLFVIRAVILPWSWEHSAGAIDEILASFEFLAPPPVVYPD